MYSLPSFPVLPLDAATPLHSDDGLRSNAKIVLDNTLNNKEVFGGEKGWV